MNKTTISEVAAGMLSTTICDFITCNKETPEFRISEKWINDNSEDFLTFTYCCKTLGLDPIALKDLVTVALNIQDFPSVPQLYLVQSSGLGYNENYEANHDSHRTGEAQKSER